MNFKGKCGVKLVAAKVILQRAFFSALSYFFYNFHYKKYNSFNRYKL